MSRKQIFHPIPRAFLEVETGYSSGPIVLEGPVGIGQLFMSEVSTGANMNKVKGHIFVGENIYSSLLNGRFTFCNYLRLAHKTRPYERGKKQVEI
jgi:hypothetical protein